MHRYNVSMRLLAALLRWTYIVCGVGAIAIGAILLADGSSTALAIVLVVFGLANVVAGITGWGLWGLARAVENRQRGSQVP